MKNFRYKNHRVSSPSNHLSRPTPDSRCVTTQSDFPHLCRTRGAARDAGHKHFYTGVPCIHGHHAPRYVGSNTCVACSSPGKVEKLKCGGIERVEAAPFIYLRADWSMGVVG